MLPLMLAAVIGPTGPGAVVGLIAHAPLQPAWVMLK